MTEADDWPDRLRAAAAETLQKRAAKRDERQQLAERRQAGLAIRHQTKLNRRSAMPDQIAVDLTGVSHVDRRQLAGALARVASLRHITPAVAVVLGQLATAVRAATEETR